MEITITTYLILCPLIFLAGFVDAVAGGGGLISLPAYLFAGMPIHFAYGTNKFGSCCGTGIAMTQYAKSGEIRWRPALTAAVGALIGAWFGAQLVMILPAEVLEVTLMVILPCMALFLLANRGFGRERKEKQLAKGREAALSLAIGLAVGAYDGFFGPGTGTFLILLFSALLGFSLVTSSGCAKVINFASNIGALTGYLLGGKVLFAVAVPCAVCSIAGNWLGSRLAIKIGVRFVRALMAVVIALLFAKLLIDFLA